MIARVWRGYTTPEHADAYESMLKPELLPGLSKVQGFRGSYLLRREKGDEIADSFRVGVGSEQYPTGVGRFYIWVKVPYENPNNPYGIMALGLSGFSPVLSDWPGQGRMAVHGTPYASNRGQAVSHGCVRVYNDDMQALLDLPLGTPVEISR